MPQHNFATWIAQLAGSAPAIQRQLNAGLADDRARVQRLLDECPGPLRPNIAALAPAQRVATSIVFTCSGEFTAHRDTSLSLAFHPINLSYQKTRAVAVGRAARVRLEVHQVPPRFSRRQHGRKQAD